MIYLLLYLLDGYYEKNIKRGIYQIIAFVITVLLGIFLLKAFMLYFVFVIPFLFFGYILFIRENYNEN